MKIQLKFNSGNDRRKNMCLLFKESAKRAGVEIEVVTREWTAFLEENKRREFEMFCAGWIQSPTPDELKQIWHTESDTPDGSNYTGYWYARNRQNYRNDTSNNRPRCPSRIV